MTPAEYYADDQHTLLGLSAQNLANQVRNRHAPDCACHDDQAITEPIQPGDQE